MIDSSAFSLIGAIPYTDSDYGFYLPVFIKVGAPGTLIQSVAMIGHVIEAFTPLDDDLSAMRQLPRRPAYIGEKPIYVFSDGTEFLVGSIDEIKEEVSSAIRKINRPSLSLEWAELSGSPDQKKIARGAVLSDLRNLQSNASSERSFTQSLFIHSLLDNIGRSLKPHAHASNILAVRRQIMIHSDPDDPGIMPDNVWAKLEPSLSIDRHQLRQLVLDELPTSALRAVGSDAGPASDYIPAQRLAEIQSILRRIGRQEERLAIMLDIFIREPEVGDLLFHVHKDRGKIVKEAQKTVLAHMGEMGRPIDREFFVARLVRQVFSWSFAFTRGETLYFLALHLGKHRHVAAAILNKMQQSHAFNVLQMSPHIQDAIEKSASNVRS